MKPNLTTVFKPDLVKANNNQEQIKNIQEDVANLTPKIDEQKDNDFLESIKNAIGDVSDGQLKSAELTKNFELGLENDLTKVESYHLSYFRQAVSTLIGPLQTDQLYEKARQDALFQIGKESNS